MLCKKNLKILIIYFTLSRYTNSFMQVKKEYGDDGLLQYDVYLYFQKPSTGVKGKRIVEMRH